MGPFGDAVSATAFSATDNSAMGQFGGGTVRRLDIPAMYVTDTSATGYFGDGRQFSDGPFRRWDFSDLRIYDFLYFVHEFRVPL